MADGDNECIPYYEPGSNITAKAEAAVTGKRFVAISDPMENDPETLDATYVSPQGGNVVVSHAAAASPKVLGVASWDAGIGSRLVVITAPRALPVTADGAITAGDLVEVGTAGKAKTLGAGNPAVGIALDTVADTEDCPVWLFAGSSGPDTDT